MKKIFFPFKVQDKKFENVSELYNFYYKCDPKILTEFSKPFWRLGINLTELVHFPERFKINYIK